jgi:hypothetical protein
MSRAGVDKFLYRFDKEPQLQAAFKAAEPAAFEGFDLDSAERQVLATGDVATLYEWGIHPLLIRNFAGTLGIRYVAEYHKRGLKA